MRLSERMRLAIRREGVGGTLRGVAERAGRHIVFSEDHVWYALELTGEWPRAQLAPELTLGCPRDPDLQLLEQVPNVAPGESLMRLAAGNDLWVVLEGDRLLFSCWTFRGQTPAIAATGGQLQLPADTVCIEDSIAASAVRGRSIAPATGSAIADALAAEGKRWLITKITVENAPSRRAAEKAGFEAVALMHFRRRGPRSRAWLEALESPNASFFVDRIGLTGPDSRVTRE